MGVILVIVVAAAVKAVGVDYRIADAARSALIGLPSQAASALAVQLVDGTPAIE